MPEQATISQMGERERESERETPGTAQQSTKWEREREGESAIALLREEHEVMLYKSEFHSVWCLKSKNSCSAVKLKSRFWGVKEKV